MMSEYQFEALGSRIAQMRRRSGLTQEQLAERCSVSFQAVSKWENNLSCPDIQLLPVLAECFGTTIDELFRAESVPDDSKSSPADGETGVERLRTHVMGLIQDSLHKRQDAAGRSGKDRSHWIRLIREDAADMAADALQTAGVSEGGQAAVRFDGRDVISELHGDIEGDVGSVYAEVYGNIHGQVTGDVYSVVHGSIDGDIGGDLYGLVEGDVGGDIGGDLYGLVKGTVHGDIGGDCYGAVGALTGEVLGENISGCVPGVCENDGDRA